MLYRSEEIPLIYGNGNVDVVGFNDPDRTVLVTVESGMNASFTMTTDNARALAAQLIAAADYAEGKP